MTAAVSFQGKLNKRGAGVGRSVRGVWAGCWPAVKGSEVWSVWRLSGMPSAWALMEDSESGQDQVNLGLITIVCASAANPLPGDSSGFLGKSRCGSALRWGSV